MKKSLVALAVLAATGAYAQSSVTLYGIVEATTDIGYNVKTDRTITTNGFNAVGGAAATSPVFTVPTLGPNGFLPVLTVPSGTVAINNRLRNGMRVQDGNDQGTGTSRIGFRGAEDLGGGLKANFLLEMGLRIDDGCTTLSAAGGPACDNGGNSNVSGGSTFGRNAWGGLSGEFGEVRLGRQVLGSFGVQANSAAAGSSNGLYEVSATQYLSMGGVRFSNAIKYLTPNFGGFTANITVAAPETGGVNTSMNQVSTTTPPAPLVGAITTTSSGAKRRTGVDLALEYANGPAYVGFGYNIRDSGNVIANGISPLAGLTNNTSPGRIVAYTLGGAYDLGVVKPFINYTRQTTRSDSTTVLNTGVPATVSSLVTNGDATARFYSIGLRAPVGAVTVIAGYGRGTSSGVESITAVQGAQAGFLSSRTQNRLTAFQIGAQYPLSKRTLVEANIGQTRLENNIDATVANNVTLVSGNQSNRGNTRTSALNVGLKHSF